MRFEPLLKLLIVQDRFHLRGGGFANFSQLGHSRLSRQTAIFSQRAHRRIFLIQNRLDLRFLVVAQVEELRDCRRPVDLGGWWAIRLGSRFLVRFVFRLFLSGRHGSQCQRHGHAANCHYFRQLHRFMDV